jgi:hypothetical protein
VERLAFGALDRPHFDLQFVAVLDAVDDAVADPEDAVARSAR